MLLYASLLFLSILIPLIFSFERKLRFFKIWKSLLPSAVIIGMVYIIADIIFVRKGIWGFNALYHSGIIILGLPLEEWLFFIIIPYASIFIHYVFTAYYPNLVIGNGYVRIFSIALIILSSIIILLNLDKAYTTFNFTLLIIALIWALSDKSRILNRYLITFLIIIIPFFLVNSILTGTLIEEEVVWYNNSETLGLRAGTVPLEDIGYAFSLILLILLMNKFIMKILPATGNNDEDLH